mmetsp:Transcript_15518/g.31879  ORF Transcript_15518/g.31879 Transcript_15518/m.31879 type:complete len:80 (+) Transcript_15518:384-623(+)
MQKHLIVLTNLPLSTSNTFNISQNTLPGISITRQENKNGIHGCEEVSKKAKGTTINSRPSFLFRSHCSNRNSLIIDASF